MNDVGQKGSIIHYEMRKLKTADLADDNRDRK